MNLPFFMFRLWHGNTGRYDRERHSNISKLHLHGSTAFVEKCLDHYLMNWYVKRVEWHFPQVKRIFVDLKDEDLF